MTFKFSHKTEPYASHQPILYAYANKIKNGRIIEYGVGKYSTGLLHEICKRNNNTLVSIDNDERWLNECAKQYPGYHWHPYIYAKDYTELLDIKHDFECDLAFIDSTPWGSRLFCVRETRATKYSTIIVHDCDFITEGHTNYLPDKLGWFFKVCDTWKPKTLVIKSTPIQEDATIIDYDMEGIV